jgi:hypothetical protein
VNHLLQLKGQFQHRSRKPGGGRSLPKGKTASAQHLRNLYNSLQSTLTAWQQYNMPGHPLISVYYDRIIAKSNRIQGIFFKAPEQNNKSVVGAKYTPDLKKHIITHCLSTDQVKDALKALDVSIYCLEQNKLTSISEEQLSLIKENFSKVIAKHKDGSVLSYTRFKNIVIDSFYIERFGVEESAPSLHGSVLVSLYNNEADEHDLFTYLGIDVDISKKLGNHTYFLTEAEYAMILRRAPFLVAMGVTDLRTLPVEPLFNSVPEEWRIPHPGNEPTIGVIDTAFDDRVYFHEWVDSHLMLEQNIRPNSEDKKHGTSICSLIVDGPSLNPGLDDGCGRFRVRHFGVATKRFSSFLVMKKIKEIVEQNQDIHVWNLSLGSGMEINPNFISPEAAVLDDLQSKYNVVFVVAGTNKTNDTPKPVKIGAPADSINSIVVNSVELDGTPAEYTRCGPVLSFFNKPDVSYYGGTQRQPLRVFSSEGAGPGIGTSYAAPWIARKMAYLMDVMNLPREVAKALLVDSAVSWNRSTQPSVLTGYGVVPVRITDVLQSKDDEIKFFILETAFQYDTYNYGLPVPVENDKHPYIARVSLCYFTQCNRNQGVDYTDTELDLHIGPMKPVARQGSVPGIHDIQNNCQAAPGFLNLPEETVRKFYRKWDNLKIISETLETQKGRSRRPRLKGERGLWGISVKTKARQPRQHGEWLNFGLVVTLKALDGKNRIQEFIQSCTARGWIVQDVDIEVRTRLHVKSQAEIQFE